MRKLKQEDRNGDLALSVDSSSSQGHLASASFSQSHPLPIIVISIEVAGSRTVKCR